MIKMLTKSEYNKIFLTQLYKGFNGVLVANLNKFSFFQQTTMQRTFVMAFFC